MKKTTLFFSLLVLLISSIAFARPPAEVLELIEKTYDPTITVQRQDKKSTGVSCITQETVLSTKDPVTGKQRTVDVKMYEPRYNRDPHAPKRGIVLIPPIMGENIIDRLYAAYFCENQIHVLIVQQWQNGHLPTVELKTQDEQALRAISAIRNGVQYMRSQNVEKVGLFGTSLGAIMAIPVLNLEADIKAAVLIVGGVNLPHIMAYSEQKEVARIRSERVRKYGFPNAQEYENRLREEIKLEPFDFLNLNGSKDVFVVTALRDTSVPTIDQKLMIDTLQGNIEVKAYEKDHVPTVLATYRADRDQFKEWFKKAL
ncbi:MAG: hypothetical protein AB7O96_02660 [Pseudobdellovibrionaceae bacterium]